MSGELAVSQFFISFGLQREMEAGLEPPSQFSKVLKSKLHGKYKQKSTPPGVGKRNASGPIAIVFKYGRVQYNREERRLEIMKGEFVGKRKPTEGCSSAKDNVKKGDRDDDVDKDDGQVPFDVVPDYNLRSLCFLF